MMNRIFLFAVIASLFTTGCASEKSGGGIDAPVAVDAPIDAIVGGALPTWTLEDVQPTSPRAGQTYGLDTFANKSVVVVLLEGF